MAQLNFEETLTAILQLVGKRVVVSIGAGDAVKPGMVAALHGTLAAGSQMAPGSWAGVTEEAFYFSFAEDTGAGFFLHAEGFREAEWLGYPGQPEKALRILSGPLEIVLERDPGSDEDRAYLTALLEDANEPSEEP